MKPRRTLSEMAAEGAGAAPLEIAGKPAVQCPYCGAGMFVTGTRAGYTNVRRYEHCRICDKSFETKQPQKVFIREM